MLEPWAMASPRLRKRAAAKLFEESNLHEAACLRALNPVEARNFRARGLDAPIACIANGISVETPIVRSRAGLDAMFPQLAGTKVALFLGRIHPKKGLPMLLRAMRQIGRAALGWRLLIAGPDEAGHAREILSLAQSLGVDSQIVLSGALDGNAKQRVLAGADAFVLPSHSEGFSMAVLEGAAAGLPVLLTRPCNFRELAEQGGAIEVAAEEAAIREGFEHLIRMTDEERREMGEAGRAFVEQTYAWPLLGAMMAETCHWIAQGGEAPPFVDPGRRAR
jgi:glycosyltransferase involved in cell wall biosynthesis